ncbi:MAG: hypothetical protein WCH39_29425, partial [Schlesneria sp.]
YRTVDPVVAGSSPVDLACFCAECAVDFRVRLPDRKSGSLTQFREIGIIRCVIVSVCTATSFVLSSIGYCADVERVDALSVGAMVTETASYKALGKLKGVEFPKRDGLAIVGVFPYSPLAKEKVKPLDIVIAVNGHPVASVKEWNDAFNDAQFGENAKLDVLPVKLGKKITWGASKKISVKVLTRGDIALAGIRREKDKVDGSIEVWHKDTPDSYRGDDASDGNDISFHFSMLNDKPGPLKMRVCYSADDWIFVESVSVSVDETPSKIDLRYAKWFRDNNEKRVWEWCDVAVNHNTLEALRTVLTEYDVTLRVSGDKFFRDRDLTAIERGRMMTVLTAYEMLGGKLPIKNPK